MQKKKLTDAQRQLIEENLGLARMAAWKYREPCAKVGIDWDDAYAIACEGIIRGVQRYKPELGRASTYLIRGCELAILMELRKFRQKCRAGFLTVSLSDIYCGDRDGNALTIEDTVMDTRQSPEEESVTEIMLQSVMKKLTSRQKIILQMALDGFTQDEIGRALGLSQSYVSRLFIACKKQIQEAVAS